MSNAKGNVYPFLIISQDYQVIGVQSDGKQTPLSEKNFAGNFGISEDGTIWVLSLTADPDGGGAKLFWSNGDSKWNEINTSDPGGIIISGGAGDSCYFITAMDELWSMNPQGQGQKLYDGANIYSMDYGGNFLWAVLSDKPGEIPALHFASSDSPTSWTKFDMGNASSPFSISVGYEGNCYGVADGNPMYYSNDGHSSGSAGGGADGIALETSFKKWNYLLTANIDIQGTPGNEIMKWVDTQGGIFQTTNVYAYKVLATYNTIS